jgi:hypothetical protein
MLEPIQDLPRDEQIKTLGRLRPLRLWLLEPWEHYTDIAQILVGVHELLRLLTEADYLTLVEGSSFATAWDELIEAITEHECNNERFARCDEAGRATGLEMLRRLQSKGLFGDPVLVELTAA